MTLLVCALLTAAVLVFVFYPSRTLPRLGEKTRLEFLRERKDTLYDNLRDLNFDYRSGKYREDEYALERASLEDEAAAVLGEMETLEAARR
ncbi:MAG TPA: hypothetical protein VGD62_01890 [Acidobacteriaceae bacterium]